jgi:mono/diheme cytochrome c family protein
MRPVAALLPASVIALVTAAACQQPAPPPPPPPAAPQPTPVERGQYIVNTGGCHDCHTPWKMGAQGPEPDMSRALSGHPAGAKVGAPPKFGGGWAWAGYETNTAFAGPWGISFAANLTPNELVGIGIWTEDMFVRAIKTGKHMGEASSRDILPPMPWPAYRNLTDADLKAVYAYLRTLPPSDNRVPDPVAPPDMGKMK